MLLELAVVIQRVMVIRVFSFWCMVQHILLAPGIWSKENFRIGNMRSSLQSYRLTSRCERDPLCGGYRGFDSRTRPSDGSRPFSCWLVSSSGRNPQAYRAWPGKDPRIEAVADEF